MTLLTDAIFFAGAYDQLNLASLACFETLFLRVAQLVESYAGGDPQRPNWAGVEHFHLADTIHRLDERLVTVTQIDRTPDRC